MADAFRQRPRQHHGNDGTHRMPKQAETLPPQLFGDLQHVMGVIPQRIAGAVRPMPGMTVPGHVQRNDAQAFEFGRQSGKAVGIVEPAMQCNHRQTVLGAEQMRGQLDMRQAQAHFFEGRAHAQSLS
ncbi:hypothetical protein D3C81_1484050 [compost metagenome]